MKKLLVLFLLISQTVFAQNVWTVETVPNTRLKSDYIHISDPDNWIEEDYETKINDVLSGIRSQADVFVVVLSSIGDNLVESFALDLFDYWGIGEEDLDNGVLMLMVEDQHKLRFETGYGVEDELPDAVCQRIFTKVIVPYFKEGDYNGGLYAGVCSVAGIFGQLPEDATVTEGEIVSLKSIPSRDNEPSISSGSFLDDLGSFKWVIFFFIAVANIFLLYRMIRDMVRLKKEVDPQKGDVETLSKLFDNVKTSKVFFVVLGIICICPLVLLLYPFYVSYANKKLKYYRDTPRKCESCGSTMRRLSEEEEDAYMTDSQRFEEDKINVKDYDIWLCDSCGYKMAVPFLQKDASNYHDCPSCHARAAKNDHDEVIVKATEYSSGKGVHHFSCAFCGYHYTENYTIPKLSSNDSSSSSSRSGHSSGSFGGGRSGGGGYTGSW